MTSSQPLLKTSLQDLQTQLSGLAYLPALTPIGGVTQRRLVTLLAAAFAGRPEHPEDAGTFGQKNTALMKP